jgi:hypothetical protein
MGGGVEGLREVEGAEGIEGVEEAEDYRVDGGP